MNDDMDLLALLRHLRLILLQILGSEQLLQVLSRAIDNDQDLPMSICISDRDVNMAYRSGSPSYQAVLRTYSPLPTFDRRIIHLDILSLRELPS